MPARHKLDACAMGPRGILPCIWMADRSDGGFVYRLAGAEIADAWKNDRLVGKSLVELIEQPALSFVLGNWNRVLNEQVILHTRGQIYTALGRYRVGERIVLPLAPDDNGVETVVGVTIYGAEQKTATDSQHDPSLRIDVMAETPVDMIWKTYGGRVPWRGVADG